MVKTVQWSVHVLGVTPDDPYKMHFERERASIEACTIVRACRLKFNTALVN